MEWHSFAEKFHRIPDGPEWEEFKNDIALTEGNTRPIEYRMVGSKRQGLDGRNRLLACEELGLTPSFKEIKLKDEDCVAYIVRANILRRHLDAASRKELVAMLREEGKGTREISEILKVSKSTVHNDIKDNEDSKASPGVQNWTPDSKNTGKTTGKDGKEYPAAKKKVYCPGCQHRLSIGRDLPEKCEACAELRGKKKPPPREIGDEPEEETSEGCMKRVNAEIESFCRKLMAFVDAELPTDLWLSDMNRREGAIRKFKDGCETLRSCKCSGICPRCKGEGTDGKSKCKPCHGSGRLPKLNLDQLG